MRKLKYLLLLFAALVAVSAQAQIFPATTYSAKTLPFANWAIGTTPTLSVTVTNSGTQSLTISSIAMQTGTVFTETNTCPGTVAIGASCVITVKYTPLAVVASTDTLNITSTAFTSPDHIAVSGAGVASVAGGPMSGRIGEVQDVDGRAMGGQNVIVCAYNIVNYAPVLFSPQGNLWTYTGPVPCTTPLGMFSDTAGTQVITQPEISDSQGNYNYWEPAGLYTECVTGPNVTAACKAVPIGNGGGILIGGVPGTTNLVAGTNITLLTNTPTAGSTTINAAGGSSGCTPTGGDTAVQTEHPASPPTCYGSQDFTWDDTNFNFKVGQANVIGGGSTFSTGIRNQYTTTGAGGGGTGQGVCGTDHGNTGGTDGVMGATNQISQGDVWLLGEANQFCSNTAVVGGFYNDFQNATQIGIFGFNNRSSDSRVNDGAEDIEVLGTDNSFTTGGNNVEGTKAASIQIVGSSNYFTANTTGLGSLGPIAIVGGENTLTSTNAGLDVGLIAGRLNTISDGATQTTNWGVYGESNTLSNCHDCFIGGENVSLSTNSTLRLGMDAAGELDIKAGSVAVNYLTASSIVCTNGSKVLVSGGCGTIALKTNGTANGSQAILNLAAGSNMTLTDNGSGTITLAASGSGGATTPGGSSGQIEYNAAGSFGGFTMSQDCTIVASTGVITCTKTNNVSFATSATTDTTNASNIASGTLGAARLPNPTASTLGGIESLAAVTSNWIRSISTSGVPAASQPNFTDLAGSIALAQTPLTTAGDLLFANASPALARLAIGTNGQCLTVSSSLPAWGSCVLTPGANTALSNLSAVAINTSLLPGTVNTVDLGSSLLPARNVYVGAIANRAAELDGSLLSANRLQKFPDEAGTFAMAGDALTCAQMPVISSGDTTRTVATCPETVVKIQANPVTITSIQPYDFLQENAAGTAIINTPGQQCENKQTGTSYTFLASDRGCLVMATNAGAQAYSLPQAGSAGFTANYYSSIANLPTTATPATGPITVTVSAGSDFENLPGQPSTFVLDQGERAYIISDNTNYFVLTVEEPPTFGVQAQADYTGRATAIGSSGSPVTLFTTPASPTGAAYEIRSPLSCDGSSAAATVTFTLKWTDPSSTVQTSTSSAATCTTLGASSFQSIVNDINVKGGTAVLYYTTIVSTPTYSLHVLLEGAW